MLPPFIGLYNNPVILHYSCVMDKALLHKWWNKSCSVC